MKNSQGQHLDDVKKLIMRGKHSDSFAAHFVRHCTSGVKPSNKELREMMKYQIIWQGNLISCMKTFGKEGCSLCMRERIKILKAQQLEENYLINLCYKFFGECRHKTRFHRFLKEKQSMKSTSTDEGIKPERVNRMDGKRKGDKKKSPRLARSHDPPLGDINFCWPMSRNFECVT